MIWDQRSGTIPRQVQLVTECLEELLKRRNSLSATKWVDLIEKGFVEERDHRDGIDHTCKVFSGEDPLFGYYPAGDVEQLRALTKKMALKRKEISYRRFEAMLGKPNHMTIP